MERALLLAGRARGRTTPNPPVGAVVVTPEGVVAGTGFHERAGEPHAEVFALREAGRAARGATLYCTLEPCSHFGRTPPCVDRVLEAGVARVVAAVEDPNVRVSGGGVRRLRQAGVRVDLGVGPGGKDEFDPDRVAQRLAAQQRGQDLDRRCAGLGRRARHDGRGRRGPLARDLFFAHQQQRLGRCGQCQREKQRADGAPHHRALRTGRGATDHGQFFSG